MTMPIALGLVDPEGAEVELASADASPAELRSGVFALEGARRTLEFTGVARRPALSFLRGFSARRARRRRPRRRRSCRAARARSRSFQSLAGAADLGDAPAAAQRRGDPLGAPADARARLYRRLWLGRRRRVERPHRPGLRGAGAQLAQRSRHRARNGGRTSIPTRSTAPARTCAARSGAPMPPT